jgi:RNA polymerase sigma-70 factor (ECF subfamily)
MDRGLLVSAVEGDRNATDALLRILRPVVLSYCRARLGSQHRRDSDAEDCAQEILLGVLGALPGYRHDVDKFLGFVFGIAAHKVVDARRRGGRDISAPVAEPRHMAFEPLCDDGDLEGRQRVEHLLSQLASQQRDVVILRVLVGLSARETAGALGMASEGAVRVSQHRALISLRRRITGALDARAL